MDSSRLVALLLVLLVVMSSMPTYAGGLIGDIISSTIDVPILPEATSSQQAVDPAVAKAANEALIAYYQTYKMSLRAYEAERAQSSEAIRWQMTTARIVFTLVILIVASGVAFCWAQFWLSRRTTDSHSVADVELSATGVKVSSPVLGVVVLALSLAFFYLYLQFVYPIHVIGETTITKSEPPMPKLEANSSRRFTVPLK